MPKPSGGGSGGGSSGNVASGGVGSIGSNGMGGVSGKVSTNKTTNNTINQNTTFNTLQQSRGNYAPPGSYPTTAHSAYDNIPLLTSKQELSLFLRWLNSVYDGVSKASDSNSSTSSTTTTDATNTTTNNTAKNSTPALTATIDPPLNIRQGMIKHISTQLHNLLSHRTTEFINECVRNTEYTLLCKASSVGEYMNLTSLTQRIVDEVNAQGWNSTTTNTSDSINTSSNSNTSNTSSNGEWRSLITEEIRQDMIYRVEKMLRLVSMQLGINTVEDLNCKIQQYEMGLVVSANSLDEYVDKGTMPKRLAQLVTDFADYKKTLSPDQMIVW